MKNVHHMLPPTHRRFWSALEEIRKQEKGAGKAWRYEADPFAVKREHEAARAKQERLREAAAEAAKNSGKSNNPSLAPGGRMKGWMNVPVVDMSHERRKEAEDIIRRYHVWNPYGIEMKKPAQERIVKEMVELGFRKAHVEEACESVKDRKEALEWLLIHVPEDDLPSRFIPENYAAGITVSTGELGVEYAAKRLSVAGYSLDLCREVLSRNCFDEDRAAEALMQMLVYGVQKSPVGPRDEDLIVLTDKEDDPWDQEQISLEAIYAPERFTCVSPTVSRVSLDLHQQGPKSLPKIILEVRKPTVYAGSAQYPDVIPTFVVITEGERKLPAYVRLSIIRQVAEYAEDLKGDQMIFTVVDWLENEIPRVVENPGRLMDVASAVTGSDKRNDNRTEKQQRQRKHRGKKRAIDWTPGTPESLNILRSTEERLKSPAQKKMLEARQRLPAWQVKEDITKAVNTAQVVIIR
jgi:ATP-dependent RNA helicase DHX57